MSQKLTAKEESYARARAAGKGPSDAYRASRDCSHMSTSAINSNAKREEKKPAIQARIEELKRGESQESPQESPSAEASTPGAANRLIPQEEREGHGGEGHPASPAPRLPRLDSLGGVVREMAAVYREVRAGKTEPDIGCKLTYILKEIRAALEAHVLERLELRLEAIEAGRRGHEPQRAIPPPH